MFDVQAQPIASESRSEYAQSAWSSQAPCHERVGRIEAAINVVLFATIWYAAP